jgi:hypothetical protein
MHDGRILWLVYRHEPLPPQVDTQRVLSDQREFFIRNNITWFPAPPNRRLILATKGQDGIRSYVDLAADSLGT